MNRAESGRCPKQEGKQKQMQLPRGGWPRGVEAGLVVGWRVCQRLHYIMVGDPAVSGHWLGSSSSCLICELCDLELVAQSVCTFISSFGKWE